MTKNDITGDDIKSKVPTEDYRSGYELIWPTKNKRSIMMKKGSIIKCTSVGKAERVTTYVVKSVHEDHAIVSELDGDPHDLLIKKEEIDVGFLERDYLPNFKIKFDLV